MKSHYDPFCVECMERARGFKKRVFRLLLSWILMFTIGLFIGKILL